jgi:hypothetical protein
VPRKHKHTGLPLGLPEPGAENREKGRTVHAPLERTIGRLPTLVVAEVQKAEPASLFEYLGRKRTEQYGREVRPARLGVDVPADRP